ncbi:MAG: endonuclease/exonuclease/phosphatase family protein [Reichenbachiella sp.]
MMRYILLLFLIIGLSPNGFTQVTSFMTYNIKNDYQKEGENNWISRKPSMIALLNYYEPEVFGVQEALINQLQDLDAGLSKYSFIGIGREDGKMKGEYAAIFYDRTQYKLHEQGNFWLSETPDKVSKGWDAAYERICTYGLFEHLDSKRKVWVFNAHFDHIGQLSRENSAKLIVQKISSINKAGWPVVLMGDFNAEDDNTAILTFASNYTDCQKEAKKTFYGPEGTFNGFTKDIMTERIDFIFSEKFNILSYVHIDDRMQNFKHVSDHIPVMMTCDFD